MNTKQAIKVLRANQIRFFHFLGKEIEKDRDRAESETTKARLNKALKGFASTK